MPSGSGSDSPMRAASWGRAGNLTSVIRIVRKDTTMQKGVWRSLRLLSPLALTVLVGATSLAPTYAASRTAAAAANVPMYRGSASGNQVVTTGQNLALNWTSPFLKSLVVDATPYGNLLFVSGMVTTPQYTRLYGGSEFQDPFYALDLHTGKVVWQVTVPNWHTRAPAVANGTVYLGV